MHKVKLTILTVFSAEFREFPGGPVVRTQRFHCCGPGSIPSQGSCQPCSAAKKKSVQFSGIKYIYIVQLTTVHLQNFFTIPNWKLVPMKR